MFQCIRTLWMLKSVWAICLPNFYDFLVTILSECLILAYSIIPCVLVRLFLLWWNAMIQSKLGSNGCFLNAYNVTGHPKGLRPSGEHEETCLMYDDTSALQCLLYTFSYKLSPHIWPCSSQREYPLDSYLLTLFFLWFFGRAKLTPRAVPGTLFLHYVEKYIST